MKLVIYRDKKSNQITGFHEVNEHCTEENIKKYNEDEKYPAKAEIVELEENSPAYYFYSFKIRKIEEEAENLRDIMDDLQSIANRIDDRLYDFDKWFKEKSKNC